MNVEREYSVVGTWEHTNETLAVLEAYVPRYFADASKMYYCKSRWELCWEKNILRIKKDLVINVFQRWVEYIEKPLHS